MTTKELLDFIKKSREEGHPDTAIRDVLVQNGWLGSDVDEGFKELEKNLPPPVVNSAPKIDPAPRPVQASTPVQTPVQAVPVTQVKIESRPEPQVQPVPTSVQPKPESLPQAVATPVTSFTSKVNPTPVTPAVTSVTPGNPVTTPVQTPSVTNFPSRDPQVSSIASSMTGPAVTIMKPRRSYNINKLLFIGAFGVFFLLVAFSLTAYFFQDSLKNLPFFRELQYQSPSDQIILSPNAPSTETQDITVESNEGDASLEGDMIDDIPDPVENSN